MLIMSLLVNDYEFIIYSRSELCYMYSLLVELCIEVNYVVIIIMSLLVNDIEVYCIEVNYVGIC